MFQSLLSPIRSRFDTSRFEDRGSSDQTSTANANLTHPQELLSPRSPLAWGVTSPALSVFGGRIRNTGTATPQHDYDDMANTEEFARDVLVELLRGTLEDMRVQSMGIWKGVTEEDLQRQVKVWSCSSSRVVFLMISFRSCAKFTVLCSRRLLRYVPRQRHAS